MIVPTGKTEAWIKLDVHQSDLNQGDEGYIDGYCQAADTRGYAIFVRHSDGLIDFVPLNSLMATIEKEG